MRELLRFFWNSTRGHRLAPWRSPYLRWRMETYSALNLAVERKFTFRGYRWAARIGMDNVTDRQNPTVVDNNVNSPSFLTFFGTDHRTVAGRIRFLGKK